MQHLTPHRLAVAALLAALSGQLWFAADRLSVTTDEHAHLPAGYSYWRTGDFRLNRQHPPLAKLMGAWPLLLRDVNTTQAWPHFENAPAHGSTFNYEWYFGEKLIYVDNNLALDSGVTWARRAMMPFAWLIALFTYAAARRLFGKTAGLAALALVCFSPDVLAHAGLVNTDAAVTAFFIGAPLAWLAFLERGGAARLGLAGVLLGLGLASKFSALVLLPILAVMAAVAVFRGQLAARGAVGAWLTAIAIATFVVVATYAFQEGPGAYAEGLSLLYADTSGSSPRLLLGQYSTGRIYPYFVAAALLKIPLPALGLIGLGLRRLRRPHVDLLRLTFLVVPPLALIAAATLRAEHIGVRYILGAYPYLFILGGAAVASMGRWLGALGRRALLAAAILSGVSAYPFYLAFHNLLTPTEDAFFWALEDSNNDWYQGWKEIARRQQAGELPQIILHVSEVTTRRLAYGLNTSYGPFSGPQRPGVHAMSAYEYFRSRAFMGGDRNNLPLLYQYPVREIVAGAVVLIDVPLDIRQRPHR